MKNQKEYFKRPKKGDFVRACLPIAALLLISLFLIVSNPGLIKWLIKRSEPLLLFPDPFDLIVHSILAGVFLLWLLKNFVGIYNRMQKMPFLGITKEGIRIDLDISRPLRGGGMAEVGWSQIRRLEMQQNKFIVYFQKNGKEKSIKTDLAWIQEKEDLITTLKTECQEHQIIWVEKS